MGSHVTDSCEDCEERLGWTANLHASCWWLAVMPSGDVQQECIWMVEQWAQAGRKGRCPMWVERDTGTVRR